MAHSISWTTTVFESTPVSTNKLGLAWQAMQTTRKAVGERLRTEHCMDDAEATSGNQGKHNMGSARAFYYTDEADLPAVPSESATFDSDDGYAKGRVALIRWDDPDDVGVVWYKMLVYKVDSDSSAWVEPSYVHLSDVDEDIQGVKTFKEWPLVEDVSGVAADDPYAGAGDDSLVPVASVKQALEDYLDTVRDAIIPVGFIYTQLPGYASPQTLWPWATWSYSSTATAFNGAFFRAEGSGAAGFGAGVQAQQLLNHAHAITNTANAKAIGETQVTTGEIDHDEVGSDHPLLALATSTDEYPGASATENRPRNFTVRLWVRTA